MKNKQVFNFILIALNVRCHKNNFEIESIELQLKGLFFNVFNKHVTFYDSSKHLNLNTNLHVLKYLFNLKVLKIYVQRWSQKYHT